MVRGFPEVGSPELWGALRYLTYLILRRRSPAVRLRESTGSFLRGSPDWLFSELGNIFRLLTQGHLHSHHCHYL